MFRIHKKYIYMKLLSIRMNYKKAEDSYEEVVQEIAPTSSDEDYPKVDFAKMKKINPEAVGFIYCKDLLRYPIVQGEDNDKYLHTMFNGEYHNAGTLFVDARIPEALEARHCIVYGHNMQDGSMFGKLYKYSDKDFYEAHREFHVYTEDHHYRYKAFAAYSTTVHDFTYTFSFRDDEDFMDFLDKTKRASWFADDTELTKDSKILTLSTCVSTTSEDIYRNVLILVREEEIKD